MPTSEASPGLLDEERGAIMVLGIFLCTCLVGALWYLAGIGDAILHRERVQEAADAMAFSSAALHARGMNLLVLVNLVMACVLGVRVAFRSAALALKIAAGIFAGLGFVSPPLFAAASACAAAAVSVQEVGNAADPAINTALIGLSAAQDAVSAATPTLARVAVTVNVGPRYVPVVRSFGVVTAGSDVGLAVERGSEKKLCQQAGMALPDLVGSAMKGAGLDAFGEALKVVGELMASLVQVSPDYFCGMSGSAPSTDSFYEQPAADRCDGEPAAEHVRFQEAERRWLDGCREAGVACVSRDTNDPNVLLEHGSQSGTPVDPTAAKKISSLLLERDQCKRSIDEYQKMRSKPLYGGRAECIAWAKADMKRTSAEQQEHAAGKQSDAPSGGSNGTRPMATSRQFKNGAPIAQFVGVAAGDESRLRRSARIVRVGAWGSDRAVKLEDPRAAPMPSWAQAEVFYDCSGRWGDADCNADEDAMWHFRWRARLRRFNEPMSLQAATLAAGLTVTPPDVAAFADRLAAASELPPGRFASNAALRADLEAALKNATNRSRGAH